MKRFLKYLISNWILIFVCFLLGVSVSYFTNTSPKKYDLEIHKNIDKDLPPSLRVYYYCNYYSDSLDIPINFLYGIANVESTWNGPFDFRYKPNVKSQVGALGPMQVMPSTANYILGKNIPKEKLQNDIELNIKISAILIKKLYKQYGDWHKVFGAYNTGSPVVNNYSNRVYNYQPIWSDSVIVNLSN